MPISKPTLFYFEALPLDPQREATFWATVFSGNLTPVDQWDHEHNAITYYLYAPDGDVHGADCVLVEHKWLENKFVARAVPGWADQPTVEAHLQRTGGVL